MEMFLVTGCVWRALEMTWTFHLYIHSSVPSEPTGSLSGGRLNLLCWPGPPHLLSSPKELSTSCRSLPALQFPILIALRSWGPISQVKSFVALLLIPALGLTATLGDYRLNPKRAGRERQKHSNMNNDGKGYFYRTAVRVDSCPSYSVNSWLMQCTISLKKLVLA